MTSGATPRAVNWCADVGGRDLRGLWSLIGVLVYAAPPVKPDRRGWHPMVVRKTLLWVVAALWVLTAAVSALAADNLTLAPGSGYERHYSSLLPNV